MKNDHSTILHIDIQYEIPPPEILFQEKTTYEVRIKIGSSKTILNLILILVDSAPAHIK